MQLLSVVLLSVVVFSIEASWISDLTSAKGLNFGDGISLKLEDTKAKNSSFLERLALRVDNQNLGISMAQNAKKKAVELDFYVKDKVEGRGKKMGNMIMPFIMGAAGAGFMTMAVGGVKVMVMKSMMLAKIALIFSLILILGKLMKEGTNAPRQVEIEHHAGSEIYPVYAEYPQSAGDSSYSPTATGGGYGPYSYGPSASESMLTYATVEAPGGNGTAAAVPVVQQVIPAAKRRDYKRKSRPMVLTITHITQPAKDGLI